MGYRNDDPLKMIQVIFQNRKRPDVQIIGRLVYKMYPRPDIPCKLCLSRHTKLCIVLIITVFSRKEKALFLSLYFLYNLI